MEDSREPLDTLGESVFVGGVRPHVTAPSASSGVSCPRMDLASEEDRSRGVGLFEESRRNVAPILEDRILLRISSLFESIKIGFKLGSRPIPRDGTADNLSMSGGNLLDACAGRMPVSGPVRPLLISGVLIWGRTMLLVILSENL